MTEPGFRGVGRGPPVGCGKGTTSGR